jgi:hypothetical protein
MAKVNMVRSNMNTSYEEETGLQAGLQQQEPPIHRASVFIVPKAACRTTRQSGELVTHNQANLAREMEHLIRILGYVAPHCEHACEHGAAKRGASAKRHCVSTTCGNSAKDSQPRGRLHAIQPSSLE